MATARRARADAAMHRASAAWRWTVGATDIVLAGVKVSRVDSVRQCENDGAAATKRSASSVDSSSKPPRFRRAPPSGGLGQTDEIAKPGSYLNACCHTQTAAVVHRLAGTA